MKGIPTSAGSASRRENEFRAGGGTQRLQVNQPLRFSRSSRLRVRFHSTADMAHAKTRRREEGSGGGPVVGRRRTPLRLRGFAASLIRVPGRCRAMEKGAVVGGRVRGGELSPLRGWFSWGDGTQRSRDGLSSDGPPGLGARLGSTRSCRGVSGSNPFLLREFSIPIPIPIPMPTCAARVCRAGSSSAGGVSVRRLCRMGTASFCDFL
jgi:hypothetical protein